MYAYLHVPRHLGSSTGERYAWPDMAAYAGALQGAESRFAVGTDVRTALGIAE